MRVEKRLQPSPAALALASLGAIAFTLLVSSLLVLAAGAPVGRTYGLLLQGAFGSVFAWSETLTRAVPLLLTGLAAAVAFRARLFNIGAEGQLYAGAPAASTSTLETRRVNAMAPSEASASAAGDGWRRFSTLMPRPPSPGRCLRASTPPRRAPR